MPLDPQKGGKTSWAPPPLHDRTLTGTIMYKSCTDDHGCFKLLGMIVIPHPENSMNYDASLFSLSKHMTRNVCSSLKSSCPVEAVLPLFPWPHVSMHHLFSVVGKECICPMPMTDYLTIMYTSKLLAQMFLIFIYSTSWLTLVLKLL